MRSPASSGNHAQNGHTKTHPSGDWVGRKHKKQESTHEKEFRISIIFLGFCFVRCVFFFCVYIFHFTSTHPCSLRECCGVGGANGCIFTFFHPPLCLFYLFIYLNTQIFIVILIARHEPYAYTMWVRYSSTPEMGKSMVNLNLIRRTIFRQQHDGSH